MHKPSSIDRAGAPQPPSADASPEVTRTRWNGTSRYEIVGRLGEGGMGVVYEAIDNQRRQRVALKTLLRFDPAGLYRFKQEFRTLADVVHPNLVHLHELVASEQDEVFFTMELVEGTDFLGHFRLPGAEPADGGQGATTMVRPTGQGGASEPPREAPSCQPGGRTAVDFDKLRHALRQLAHGVRALHNAGKLHRDLKPSNVRVTPEGRVVVLDFGVATELRRHGAAEDEIVGSATYMAPEQAMGEAPQPAADWYSVGAMLYEALAGQPPFTGDAMDVLSRKSVSAPDAPSTFVSDVPEDLEALALALLAPDPNDRPTAADILRHLGTTLSGHPPAARVSDAPEEARLFGREAQLLALRDAFEKTRHSAVAVRVSGLSGFGKSALVNHFLDELEARSDTLVFRGRAYERESVPYKAVDSVVDALTRHLLDLHEHGESLALPAEAWALAHVFPVLRRVPGIDTRQGASTDDPQVVRQLAFGVLREAFVTLSKSHRVVVFIDDVQWGDADSAALLVALMRQPDAPPLLLVMTHRTEEGSKGAFLADLRARWPEDAEIREIEIGPLDPEEAKAMALALLGADDTFARQAAEAIARESRGSPFLLDELARSTSAHHRVASTQAPSTRSALSLDHLLAERAALLPVDARRLLDVVAIGGHPLPVATVATAAGIDEQAPQLVTLLRARRFVRTGLRDGIEIVEPIHDRIREIVVAQLPAATAREHHARLARVLEAAPDSDPEAIATHLLGAGDAERAALFAERAAEQAITKLAFAQAARLFQLTIETRPASSPDTRRLQKRLAEACEWAGLGERAARAYLAAAEGATALERVDLERAAAAQLMAAGHFDEGGAVFRRVLGAIGRPLPGSMLGTLFWVVFYRVLSVVLGRSTLGESKDLAPGDQIRLDALYAATRGLALVDPISALYLKARYLVDALRSRNRPHIIRAAATEASSLASGGGREGKRERTLFALARRLADESGDREGQGLYAVTFGISLYLRGHWKPARELLDVACKRMAAVRRWNANASLYAVYALCNEGDLREVKARTLRLFADAEERGDLYTVVNLRASHPNAAWLAANDADGARRQLREALAKWSKTRFLVQHWQAMLWEAEVDLYTGDGARAWDRLARDARALKRSLLLSVQLMRAFTLYVRGRAAIASLETLPEADRAGRLAAAKHAAKALDAEAMGWTAPLGAIVAAGVARATGDATGAERCLRRAIELAETAAMPLHAASARLQLGVLLAGATGNALVAEAEAAMQSCGVRVPDRYAQMLVPGPWRGKA